MKNIMFLVVMLLIAIPIIHADEIFMFKNENGKMVYTDLETSEYRASETYTISQTSNSPKRYKFKTSGSGKYGAREKATWETISELEEHNGFLRPLYSQRTIRSNETEIILHRFDYDKQKIYRSITDGKGDIIKEKVLPMKGITADSNVMAYSLKTFIANRHKRSYKTFYLLSGKGKLYRISLKDMGRETLDLPSGEKIESVKIRLIPQLGIFTGVAGAMIPPTYVWYVDKKPFDWLKYQGLESGVGSDNIVISVLERTPSIK